MTNPFNFRGKLASEMFGFTNLKQTALFMKQKLIVFGGAQETSKTSILFITNFNLYAIYNQFKGQSKLKITLENNHYHPPKTFKEVPEKI